MKTRSSIALAATVLLAGCSVAAAAGMTSKASPPVNTTPHWNSEQRVTYFNKQGSERNTPTHFAEIWGDASLGG